MTSFHIQSGTPLKVPTITFPEADIIGRVEITLTDLHPAHIAARFDDPRYKHGHVNSTTWGTALDIDCRFHGPQPRKAVKVTFTIDPAIKGVEFMPFPLNSNGPAPGEIPQAITAGHAAAQAMLANLDFSATSASVLVLWTGFKEPAPFNLGFLFTDENDHNLKMPVIYDPKVQNDG